MAFGGGKGGVGKSLVCASVAIELCRRNLKVIAIDADLGALNLHTLLGMLHPAKTFADFFERDGVPLSDLCLDTAIPG